MDISIEHKQQEQVFPNQLEQATGKHAWHAEENERQQLRLSSTGCCLTELLTVTRTNLATFQLTPAQAQCSSDLD